MEVGEGADVDTKVGVVPTDGPGVTSDELFEVVDVVVMPFEGFVPPLFSCRPISTPPMTSAITSRIPMKRNQGCVFVDAERSEAGEVIGDVDSVGVKPPDEGSLLGCSVDWFIAA